MKKINDDKEKKSTRKKRNLKNKNTKSNVSKYVNFVKKLWEKILYVFVGFLLCIVLFFILCGGKNYIKLYYELRELIEVYDIISNEYYGEINKDEMIGNAIDSMLDSVDDSFTTYIDKDSTDSFLENVNGTYEGIGCTVSTDINGNIIVVDVFDDSPASDGGLLKDDIILKVDDVDYSDKNSEDLSNYIKNEAKDNVNLTVNRNGENLEIKLKRKKVEVPVVSGEVMEYSDKKIGYIRLELFSDISYKQFNKKLEKLEGEDIEGLVVDVRNNNGGYLSAVTNISSLFLKKGKVIYQLESGEKVEKIKDTTSEKKNYPIAVLVNGASASASEIFAGAIKESYDGFVVGTTTYGKGTVQKTKLLDNGSMIKYTVQKWMTPDGNFINEVGLEPTNVVEYDSSLEYDNQLEEALKLVSNN